MSKGKKVKKFLKKYLNSSTPVGFEMRNGGQEVWMDYIKPFVKEVETDMYGSAIAVMGNLDSDYKVVIEAHVDEISWLVNHIDEKGYIRVIRNGGSDHQIAPSMRAKLWGNYGVVNGVFGHPAIHIKERVKDVNLNTIFIDIGASSKEEVLDMGVEVGTVITYDADLMELGDNYLTGRALDNRIGGFTIAQVARILSKYDDLPFKLYIVNSVQEEIGLRGAGMVAKRIKPDVAFVCDVCHETTSPPYNAQKEGLFVAGEGGVLTVAPAVQNNLLDMIRDVAEDNDIPYQMAASSTSTGTDTDAFAYHGDGSTAAALMSFPLKYMHTTVETVHRNDVDSVIDTMVEFLLQLEEGHDFKY